MDFGLHPPFHIQNLHMLVISSPLPVIALRLMNQLHMVFHKKVTFVLLMILFNLF